MKKKKGNGILTKIIILVLLIYATVSLVHLRGQIESAKESEKVLQAQIDKMTASNEDIQYAIDHSEDEDVIKEVARDKLGLSEYGEKVFYAN